MRYHTYAEMIAANDITYCFMGFTRRELEKNTADPNIWGPQFWRYYHIMSLNYPANPSPALRERMKAYILSIPASLPCIICQKHASKFIATTSECTYPTLDAVVSSQPNLFSFFVRFHNYVNQKQGKPSFTLQQAYTYWLDQIHDTIDGKYIPRLT